MAKQQELLKLSGARISSLRIKGGYTQAQLAALLTELIPGIKSPITTAAVSSWETGRRTIKPQIVDALCQLFGSSREYILGRSKDFYDTETRVEMDNIHYDNLITFDQAQHMDGCPVLVCFKDKKHEDCWAIVNADDPQKIKLVSKNGTYEYLRENENTTIELFSREMDYINADACTKTHSLSMKQLLETKSYVWVCMSTNDISIKKTYDGWYIRKETFGEPILMDSVGHILPITGLHMTFEVYADRIK